MSWTKAVTIWCDGNDCSAWERPGDSTVRSARSSLTDWVYRDGEDLCPDCAEQPAGGGLTR